MSERAPCRILVAEDSATQARRAQLVLEDAGYQVVVAPDGEAAWRRLQAEPFDLVLSDINMPGVDGYELCRRAKAEPRLRSIPFVLLTAQEELAALVRGLEAGADNFINKPWAASMLLARLTGILRQQERAGTHARRDFREQMTALLLSRTTELEETHHQLSRREAELRLANEALGRERVELQVANAKLEEASRMKSQFMANMSHELRTPLNAIIGFSEMLQRESLGPLLPKQHRYADNIQSSGRHLLTLINDVLDLAKAEAGKMDLKRERVELSTVLQEAVTVSIGMAEQKRIRVELVPPDAGLFVWADPSRLKQVLLNLLSNAIKFTPAGGWVRLSAAADAGLARIAVADNGIGIAPQDQARIFEEFQQVDGTASREFQGTGLGLALSRRLVELHGGTITLESVTGQGSTFAFTVPTYQNQEAAA